MPDPSPLQLLEAHPFLRDPALELCAVGSQALAEGCRRGGLPLPPKPDDMDLAWCLAPPEARALLTAQGLPVGATEGLASRGTLGTTLGGSRVEITSFRGGGQTFAERVERDAALRDMTIGAVYWHLSDDRILDPQGGLDDWSHGYVRACGDARERIAEHPVRALRYARKAAELGFVLETRTRRALRATTVERFAEIPAEAVAGEIRRALTRCASPGVFFQTCREERVLAHFLPELAPVFDGRVAGRLRHHPELSQSLHMVLALRAAAAIAEREALGESERARLLLCVLCHDLGKGSTPAGELPSHPGHEAGGIRVVDALFDRLPGLGSRQTRKLCRLAARTHLVIRGMRKLKPGALARIYDEVRSLDEDGLVCLARVARCDVEGRLAPEALGFPLHAAHRVGESADELEARVTRDLVELRAVCASVPAEEIAAKHAGDPGALRRELREARCRALRDACYGSSA